MLENKTLSSMKETTELYIKLFCVIILIILNLAIFINGSHLSCDKCMVKHNEKFYHINQLFDEYQKGECLDDTEIKFTP